jgi:hypothetical protein
VKIGVILATRGKPRQALGVIEAMRLMASGQNEVQFRIACDFDDLEDTIGFFMRDNPAPYVSVFPWHRPAGVGACWNRIVPTAPDDLLLTMTDDALIATPNWDQIMVDTFASHPWAHPELAIACLNDTANPGQATLFAFRPSWFRHCGLFDERFAFWFSDSAIAETYSFLTGEMIPMLNVTAVLKPGVFNPRLREMRLWWQLYAATRIERMQIAAKVRADLGLLEPANLYGLVSEWLARDLRGLPQSEAIAAALPPREPDDAYLAARKTALDVIAKYPGTAAHLEAA